MTQLHKEPTNAFVSQKELMVSLVPHVHELKDDLEHLKDLRKDLRCIKYDVTRLKR